MAETKDAAKPEAGAATKRVKINRMTAAEIDARLNEVQGAQGGLKSRYAQQLIRRKAALGK